MTYAQIIAAADELGIPHSRAIAQRIAALTSDMDEHAKAITDIPAAKTPEDFIFSETLRAHHLTAIRKCQRQIDSLRRQERGERPEITDEMIAHADSTPIQSVVDFDRSGKAMAWCHPDRNPSLNWNRKHNRAHCFVCGRSFNAIRVLMERDGMTFQQAVKELNA